MCVEHLFDIAHRKVLGVCLKDRSRRLRRGHLSGFWRFIFLRESVFTGDEAPRASRNLESGAHGLPLPIASG